MSEAVRAGFVAVIGRPNVGKSTLVNALAGQKVAIVSPKPQTTRTRILAIVTRDNAQLVLVDTPGVTAGIDALRRAMARVTVTAAGDADVVLVLCEVRGERPALSAEDREVLALARRGRARVILAINKIDLLDDKRILLPWIDAFVHETGIEVVVPISARHVDGLDRLEAELIARLPQGPALFPADMVTDQAERVLCGELVREAALRALRQEVPHAIAVTIEEFVDERDDRGGLCHIEGRILVERESQKGIVVGRGGRQIKAISQAARTAIEEMLGCRVYLRLTVHVAAGWRDDERALLRLGYGQP
jgi:GTP-binding protein Era